MLSTLTPINKMKLMESRLELWAKVFEASAESLIVMDADMRIVTVNLAFRRHSQYDMVELIGKRPRGKTCDAIEGIIAEGEDIIDEFKDSPALDAGLLAAAQAVEHYEISRYGTLKAWAQTMGLDEAASLLDETLQEETATDEKLTSLAEAVINAAATQEAA